MSDSLVIKYDCGETNMKENYLGYIKLSVRNVLVSIIKTKNVQWKIKIEDRTDIVKETNVM